MKTTKSSDGVKMGFKNIAPCLLVHDVHKTVSFYVNYLNFEKIRETKDFGHVKRDNIHIEFRKSHLVKVGGCCEYNERRNLEIIVDDVNQLYNEYLLQGVHILWGPQRVPGKKRKFEVEDCNGYILMFTEEKQ